MSTTEPHLEPNEYAFLQAGIARGTVNQLRAVLEELTAEGATVTSVGQRISAILQNAEQVALSAMAHALDLRAERRLSARMKRVVMEVFKEG